MRDKRPDADAAGETESDPRRAGSGPLGPPRDYLSLLKPKIVGLLSLVALCGFLVGLPSSRASGLDGVALLVTGALAAGGSGALNNYHDRDIDPVMERTRHRPIPDGRIPPWHALILGLGLSLAALLVGTSLLPSEGFVWVGAGWLAYLGVYTIGLKRRSVWGVVLGGTAGSFAVLAGLATAGGPIPAAGWVMASLVAVWTLPHAWAQALVHVEDFRRAGVATLPAETELDPTTRAIRATAFLTVAIAGAAAFVVGPVYALGALAPLAVLALAADQLYRHPSRENARFLFRISNVVLAFLFLLWTVDAWIQTAEIGVGVLALVLGTLALDEVVFERLPAPDHPVLGVWGNLRGKTPAARR